MPQESMWVRRRSSWPCPRIAIQSRSGASLHSPSIWKDWRIGFSSAISEPWPWNQPASIGFRCSRFWRSARSTCDWSTRITSRTSRAGRPMFPTASGFSTFIPWDSCAGPFVPTTKFVRSVRLWRHRDNLIQLATLQSSAHAEGAGPDEPADSSRHQRSRWNYRSSQPRLRRQRDLSTA